MPLLFLISRIAPKRKIRVFCVLFLHVYLDLSNTKNLSNLCFDILQVAHPDRVLGLLLIHCTASTAGVMEVVKDKVRNST